MRRNKAPVDSFWGSGFPRFDRLDKMMDAVFGATESLHSFVLDDIGYPLRSKGNFPKVNVAETDTAYEVEIAIAGLNKEDVILELKNNCLYITAGKTENKKNEEKSFLYREISRRSFQRTIRFPSKVDVEGVLGAYDNGIISCTIKKAVVEEPEAVKITIA